MQTLLRGLSTCCFCLLLFACEQETVEVREVPSSSAVSYDMSGTYANAGATQIDGIGFFADIADCDYTAEGADYSIQLTGDLEGCLYVFVSDYACSPSGTYREEGREYFVGTYLGDAGTFWTDYKFEGKYEGCSPDGFFLGAEIFGRCQHPIARGSGTGIFTDVRGRLDFKDDVEAGNFPFRGHLRY
ncbi:hypothetical protein [Lewinella sp. JB7]|uniref:hypothetical protein n=1 Tax=Lewinella sp. JB7 TaxID=2962887 RepID=UPI0020C9B979|nr:hypothetical protein [Lewinella sp. JB7]MCP9236223.1 hypothetical protein [Lewinella sp. JB7]